MKGKIGIFCPLKNGDLMTAMSVLKYRDLIWPDKKIIWYTTEPYSECLRWQDVEIRHFPHGWGYPERCVVENAKLGPNDPLWEDWSVLLDKKTNRLVQEKKGLFSLTRDLDDGYFPAPHQVEKRTVDYPNISRKVFGVNPLWRWHPYLLFSTGDHDLIETFLKDLPEGKRIMIETFAESGQSSLSDELVRKALNLCRTKWGKCNFLFVSNKYLRNSPDFPADLLAEPGVYLANRFSVRQTGLFINHVDLMISVSSGISVAASAWDLRPTPIIQYTGSHMCSTVTLANGIIFPIYTDNNPDSGKEFLNRLEKMLI